MKTLLPCYSPEMTAFALRMSRTFHHKIAAVINADSGPGNAATWKEHAPTYSALVRNDSEAWLYLDAVTGPQYSPFLNAKGKFETPHRPRNKTAVELKRELAIYAGRKLDAAAGIFLDDTTSTEHTKLVEALSPRAVMPNPGNWDDAKKFIHLPNVAGLVIYEAEEWLEHLPPLQLPHEVGPDYAVLALRCPAKLWPSALEAAHKRGIGYFYATDQADPWTAPATYAEPMIKTIANL